MDISKAPIISVFDKDFNHIGRIKLYSSMIYSRNFQTYDDFQITMDKSNPRYFADGNFVIFNNNPTCCGIMKINNDDDYFIPQNTFRGKGLFYMFYDRLTVPPEKEGYRVFNNTPVEDIIYTLIKENCIDCENNRKYEMLRLGKSLHRGGNITFQTRYKVLSDEITTLLKQSGLGIKMTADPDEKTILFEVVEGVDRSEDNTKGNEPYVFSGKFSNVIKRSRTYSSEGAKTVGYVAGQGEGENREILVLNDNLSGMDRKELFIDARDITEGDSAALKDRGTSKLNEFKATDSTEFEVSTRNYREKWDLGDIVSFYDKKMDYYNEDQIVSVQEKFEDNVFGVEVTFGEPVRNITADISSNTEDIKTETRTSSDSGGDKTYTHTQTTPAMKWTVQHNLGKFPSCTITDSTGTVVIGEVKHMDKNTVEIVFSAQFAGKAFLN